MPIGMRIVINILSIPLKTRKRIKLGPTLNKQPVKVLNSVRTTTTLPINPGEMLLILLCVFKGTLRPVVKWNSFDIKFSPLFMIILLALLKTQQQSIVMQLC